MHFWQSFTFTAPQVQTLIACAYRIISAAVVLQYCACHPCLRPCTSCRDGKHTRQSLILFSSLPLRFGAYCTHLFLGLIANSLAYCTHTHTQVFCLGWLHQLPLYTRLQTPQSHPLAYFELSGSVARQSHRLARKACLLYLAHQGHIMLNRQTIPLDMCPSKLGLMSRGTGAGEAGPPALLQPERRPLFQRIAERLLISMNP